MLDGRRKATAMTIPLKKLKDEWMKDRSFRLEYERLAAEFALARAAVKTREPSSNAP
jgi:hypothetical protein